MKGRLKTRRQPPSELTALRRRVVELEAREAERQRALQVQAALYRIADLASSAEDMPAFYAAVHSIVGTLMDAHNFFIALYDEDTRRVNFPYYVDEIDPDIPSPNGWFDKETELGKGLTAYVLRTGQPLLATPEIQHDLIQRGEVQQVGAESIDWLGVPLKTGGRTLGVIAVQSYLESLRFGEQEKDLLTFVSQHIATALSRARQLGETRQHLGELAVISSLRQTLATQLRLQAVIDLVGEKIREVFDAQGISIRLYDPTTKLIHFPYLFERGQRLFPEPVPLSGFMSEIIRTGQPLVINQDAERRAAELGAAIYAGSFPKSWLGVPIVIAGEVVGVIAMFNLDREHAFTEADVRLLTTMGASMWVAIENARLFEDIERRVAERTRELAEANVRLKELDRLKSVFVSNVSHELRTPLTNINLYLSVLKRQGAEALNRVLPVLLNETARLVRLVDDVLTISRIEQGTMVIAPERCILDALLADVVSAHIARAEGKHLKLLHTLNPAVPPVRLDPERMTQVFTNLVGNAVAYTPASGVIQIDSAVLRRSGELPERLAGAAHGWARVTLCNSGPAIPARDLPHLFERFYRGSTARDSGEPGTGLGLAICKEILLQHGGHIEVESTEAAGTTFNVWLPLAD